MGLDITVYSTVTPLDPHECSQDDDEWNEDCYELGHRRTFVYEGFEQSYRGLPVDPTEPIREVGRGTKFYGNGWVATGRDSYGFRAGSYSGYGMFRAALRSAAWGDAMEYDTLDVEDARELPFFELVWFADNEGTIGPEACADLARDYLEHKDRIVEELAQIDDYYVDKFHEWGQAFKDAADTGMIDFH